LVSSNEGGGGDGSNNHFKKSNVKIFDPSKLHKLIATLQKTLKSLDKLAIFGINEVQMFYLQLLIRKI
jgi:hypothetical protein